MFYVNSETILNNEQLFPYISESYLQQRRKSLKLFLQSHPICSLRFCKLNETKVKIENTEIDNVLNVNQKCT